MPISAARLAANRANAQHSTGPKTEASKANLFRNRYSHGLTASRFIVADWENAADYEKVVAALHAEHEPRTPTETILVNRMAEHHWLRGRALVLQEFCLHEEVPHCVDPAQLALFLRYQTTHERAFSRCLAELQKLKKTRSEAEVGFESQNSAEPEPETLRPAAVPIAKSPDQPIATPDFVPAHQISPTTLALPPTAP